MVDKESTVRTIIALAQKWAEFKRTYPHPESAPLRKIRGGGKRSRFEEIRARDDLPID